MSDVTVVQKHIFNEGMRVHLFPEPMVGVEHHIIRDGEVVGDMQVFIWGLVGLIQGIGRRGRGTSGDGSISAGLLRLLDDGLLLIYSSHVRSRHAERLFRDLRTPGLFKFLVRDPALGDEEREMMGHRHYLTYWVVSKNRLAVETQFASCEIIEAWEPGDPPEGTG